MAVTTTKTNKPINPRGNDQSPLAFNRAKLYSGKALDFDGVNDDIQISSFSTTGSTRSLSYYFKSSTSGNKRIFEIRSGSFFFNSTIFDGKINTYDGSNGINTTKTFNDNKWHHVVVTHNGNNNAAIYVDGVSQELDASTFSVHDITNQTLYIGGLSGVWYDGGLSNLRLFDVSLTAAQVADLYNNPEKIVPTGVSNDALKLWLPMQEGAGTTAYDGSGNGNHGAVSGASWLHGIGAPVSQTAVIDWNKGQNLVVYSEQLNDSAWNKNNLSISADDETSPDGQDTADKITVTGAGVSIVYDSIPFNTENYVVSVYVKPGTSRYVYLRDQTDGVVKGTQWYDLQTASVGGSSGIIVDANIESANNGFYRISLECDSSASGTENLIVLGLTSSPTNAGGSIVGEYVHAWGFQAERKTTLGPYVRTGATAQTSEVLLPAGLTTGRDITGVNLFENVRKQGALNLDGNSWAEVHDNASLDITDAITLEAWVYNDGSGFDGFLGRYFTTGNNRGVMIYEINNGTARMIVSKDGINTYNAYATISQGWNHIVGTCNDTEIKIYINGVKGTDGTAPSGSIHVSSYPYEIGRYNANITTQHTNQIAQPRIYNRALTAEEVERNYNAGKNIYK